MTDQPPAILAHLDLVVEGADDRGTRTSTQSRRARPVISGITLMTPRLDLVRAEAVLPPWRHVPSAGAQLVSIRCVAQLDPLPRGHSYGPLDLTVTLPSTSHVVAFPDAPEGAAGLHGSRFTQSFNPESGPTFAAYAIVEVPAGVVELSGELVCQVDIHRRFVRGIHILATQTVTAAAYVVPIPSGRAVRLVVALDMKAYSRNDGDGTRRAQERLAQIADRARLATGADVEDRQEQGDGIMFVFPPGIDESAVLRAFYAELADQLRETNLDLSAAAAVRLRIGVDRGLTEHGRSGWTGQGPITAGRLRDGKVTRDTLDATPDAPFVLAVSESLYRDVFSERGRIPSAASFTPADMEMPDKGFSAKAWIHVPTGGCEPSG